MKKALLVAGLLLALAMPAQAYKNTAAGYSINTRAALTCTEDSIFAFAEAKVAKPKEGTYSNYYFIDSYTSDQVQELTGCQFTTAAFQEQLKNLALLKRCQLRLDTLPMGFLDHRQYENTYLSKELFPDLDYETKVDAHLRLAKKDTAFVVVDGFKKGTKEALICHSFVAANDRLYILTNLQYFTPQEEVKEPLQNKYKKIKAQPKQEAPVWQSVLIRELADANKHYFLKNNAKLLELFKPTDIENQEEPSQVTVAPIEKSAEALGEDLKDPDSNPKAEKMVKILQGLKSQQN